MVDGTRTNLTPLNIGTIEKTKIKGITFRHKKDEFYTISGSLHRYFNNGLHNANDFTLSKLVETYNQLYKETGFNPEITPLNGFEFGVNIKLPQPANSVLNRLILHKSNTGQSTENEIKYVYKEYVFKVYNKSAITNIEPYKSDNILRIEIKVCRMRYIKGKGVKCNVFADLLNTEIWERLETVLIETINDCLIIDFSQKEIDKLTDKERIKYLEYINPRFWGNLHNESRKKFAYHKSLCESFISKHSNSNLKQSIIDLIHAKCKVLRDEATAKQVVKVWDKFTTLKGSNQKEIQDKFTRKIRSENVPVFKVPLIFCKGCNKVILYPSKGQKFCSAKDVGYSEAHRCRNRVTNTKKSIEKVLSVPLLFDLASTIAPDKRGFLTNRTC